MASVKKYTQDAVCPILRHNERSAATHSNADIDINRSNENYRLSPEHNCSDFDYFKNQLKNYQCMNRKDVIKMARCYNTGTVTVEGSPQMIYPQNKNLLFLLLVMIS